MTTSIRPLTVADLPLAAAWLSEPDTNRWLTSEWRGRTVEPRLLAMALRHPRQRLFCTLHADEPCGLVGLYDIDEVDHVALAWYLLGRKDWQGRGLTTQALQLVARWGFTHLAIESLHAWAMEDNLASQKVLLKAGFQKAGQIRRACFSHGAQRDRLYFDLIKSEVFPSGAPTVQP